MKCAFASALLLSVFLAVSCNSVSLPEREKWEDFISAYQDDGRTVDFLQLARLNLALAETGQLAERAFSYTQAGYAGLVPEWNQTVETGMSLSDIYYSMGHMALAQRMAFETNVLDGKRYNLRMMERLVQTNLIFGAYPVAGKYLKILKEDPKGKRFAKKYEALLYRDSRVESDPELGERRKCIPPEDFFVDVRGLDEDLKDIIRTHPGHRQAMDYLGVMYLLDCDMDSFKAMLDEFYGTPALPVLPKSFAEAACMLSTSDPGYWKEVGVPKETFRSYHDFLSRLANSLSVEKFKGTFWYYIMRVNNQ